MRIDTLSLLAFGPFTDRVLDFSQRPGALQLVYGPNEAGKSSTLRALLGLLYGIPARTGDAYLHDQTKLRIGATLVDDAGRALRVVRRKGNKNTLADDAGNLLPESVLSGMLGGLDENLFTQMFGLDHVRLREGAEALLRGGGQLGEVLFDASMGGRGIHTLIESLRAEAESIFKQRGRTPELNAALESLREKKKLKTDAVLSPQAFVDQQQALAEAVGARARESETRRALSTEKSRLSRLLSLLPVIAKRDAVALELAQLPPSGGLPAGEEAVASQDGVLEESVRELNRRYGSVLAAERDEPRRIAELSALERDVAELRARLGRGVEGLSGLDTATRARLRKLVEAERALMREVAELSRQEAAIREQETRLGHQLVAQGEPTESALSALIAEVEREDLPGQLSRGDAELAKLRAQLGRRATQLGVALDLERLAKSPPPSEAALSELEAQLEHSARELARLAHARDQHVDELARLERARGELLAFGELATREALEAARAARDRAFDQLFEERTSAELGDAAKPIAARVRAYTAASQQADELADRMVREAQQAAELRRVDQLLEPLRSALAELAERQRSESEAQLQLRASFRAWASPLGLGECTPRSARPLLSELATLRAQLAQRDELEVQTATLSARAHERASQLRVELARGRRSELVRETEQAARTAREHGEQEACERTGDASAARRELEGWLRQAREQLARELDRAREQSVVRAQLDKLQAERSAQRGRLAVVERELAASRTRYESELTALGLESALAPDELLACVDELTQLGQRMRELSALRARLEATRLEREALRVDVRELSARFLFAEQVPTSAVEAGGVLPDVRSAELAGVQPGAGDRAASAPLDEAVSSTDVASALADLSRVQRERSEARRDRVRLRAELHKLDEQLAELGDGAKLSELRLTLEAFEPHQARARLDEIEALLEEHSHRSSDLEQSIGRLSAGLERLEQVSGAVELAEDYEQELSRARALTRRYIELKLALSLLSSEVERYRTQHQQPVLKRASELFPRLTLQRYRGLRVEYDEHDEPVLSCLLSGDRSLRVGGLSDGTRDQLYLALRIASIERYFEGRPPLPLILDDALIHLDDVRAAAALEVLGELSKQTQVLFFTHHARMVELAQSALGAQGVEVHQLAARVEPRSDGPLFDASA